MTSPAPSPTYARSQTLTSGGFQVVCISWSRSLGCSPRTPCSECPTGANFPQVPNLREGANPSSLQCIPRLQPHYRAPTSRKSQTCGKGPTPSSLPCIPWFTIAHPPAIDTPAALCDNGPAMTAPVIELDRLSKSYRSHVKEPGLAGLAQGPGAPPQPRQPRRCAGADLLHRRGRAGGLPRPQRRRQDHHPQDALRPPPPHRRRGAGPGLHALGAPRGLPASRSPW